MRWVFGSFRGVFLAMCFLAMCFLPLHSVRAQILSDTLAGTVTYKTATNIYVRFSSTAGIQIGDTLYMRQDNAAVPLMTVTQTSSTSCVGIPFSGLIVPVGAIVYARRPKPITPAAPSEPTLAPVTDLPTQEVAETTPLSTTAPRDAKKTFSPGKVSGRISAATYVNITDPSASNDQRMRYTLSMNTTHAGEKGVSLEVYTTFRHTIDHWAEVRQQFGQALKVYSLAAQYDLNAQTHFWLGRKINLNLANLGAIDGLQAEHVFKDFFTGAFVGTRPDNVDYGFAPQLFQYGGYLGHRRPLRQGQVATTIAFAEQRNGGATDRRYLYVQHSNTIIRDIQLFASAEFDLYVLDALAVRQSPRFTSAYFSLRYRVSDALSLFGSYDSRRNIVYFETYKSFLDQFLDDQTRQGLRVSFTLRPVKRVTLGASLGSRFEQGEPATRNLNSYLTFARTPVLGLSASLSGVWIETAYLTGTILGVRIYRDLFKGKVYAEAQYRHTDYRYGASEVSLGQHIAGLNLSWRIRKKLSLAVNFEGEYQPQRTFYRIYGNAVQRF